MIEFSFSLSHAVVRVIIQAVKKAGVGGDPHCQNCPSEHYQVIYDCYPAKNTPLLVY